MQTLPEPLRTILLVLIITLSATLTLGSATAATLETETTRFSFGEFGNSEKPVLRLYTSADCQDCKRVEEMLARLKLDYPQFKIVKRVSNETTSRANSLNPRLTFFVPMRGNVFTKSNYHPDEATLEAFLKNRAAYLDERAKLNLALDAATEKLSLKSAPYEAALNAIIQELETALKADNDALSQAEEDLDKEQTPAERQATVTKIQVLRKAIELKRVPFSKRIEAKQKEEADAVAPESQLVSTADQAVEDLDLKESSKAN
jgi:hypothetical protein